jgi:RNA polymerase sigma factor (sigma-70 family)
MARLSPEEMDALTRKYLKLKKAAEKSDSARAEFKSYQNYCVEKLKYLVHIRAAKYRKFSNHPDLEQDGFEALILAFNTFNPDKGSFSWWANKYISTRISRAANAHSTIRFPIKKAKELRPYKTNEIPVIIDKGADPLQSAEFAEQKESVMMAIGSLPEKHQSVVNMTYGFNGAVERPVREVMDVLELTRPQYTKILRDAKDKIKQQIVRAEN